MVDESKREGRRSVFAVCLDLISKGKLSQLQHLADAASAMSAEGPQELNRRELFERAAIALVSVSAHVNEPSEPSSDVEAGREEGDWLIEMLEDAGKSLQPKFAQAIYVFDCFTKARANIRVLAYPPLFESYRSLSSDFSYGDIDPDYLDTLDLAQLSPEAARKIAHSASNLEDSLEILKQARDSLSGKCAKEFDDVLFSVHYLAYVRTAEETSDVEAMRATMAELGIDVDDIEAEEYKREQPKTGEKIALENIEDVRRLLSPGGSFELQSEIAQAERGLARWHELYTAWKALHPDHAEEKEGIDAEQVDLMHNEHHRPGGKVVLWKRRHTLIEPPQRDLMTV